MERIIRATFIIGGLLTLGLALGFATGAGWATALWPNPDDGELSFKFVASMQAAIAAAMLWIGITGGLHMIAAGSLNLAIMFGGMGGSLLRNNALLGEETQLYTTGCLIFALLNVGLFFWARRIPEPNARPMPESMKWSYGLFVIALASVGALLISQTQEIMPWVLSELTSVLFGWMFFGDAFYFLYALIYPRWVNCAAQLWSFLAYDLILLRPFFIRRAKLIAQLEDLENGILRVKDQVITNPDRVAEALYEAEWMLNSITAYIGVLLFSFTLALNYLILHPDTGVLARLWSSQDNQT